MTFKTIEDLQDRAKMKAALNGLRRKKSKPLDFLFKARSDATGGSPLLIVSDQGKKIDPTLVRLVRVGTVSVRGKVSREGGKLVFRTKTNVNKDKMAQQIARLGTKYGANLPQRRIQIVTPQDAAQEKRAQQAKTTSSTPEDAPRRGRAPAPAPEPVSAPAPAPAPTPRASPKDRIRDLRSRASSATTATAAPEPAPGLDLGALRADLAQWQAQLSARRAAQAAADQAVATAEQHLTRLRGGVDALLAGRDLAALQAGVRGLTALDDDPELPGLVAFSDRADDPEKLTERISEWFEDIEEEHGWEIESKRERAQEKAAAVAELTQLVDSVTQVIESAG